jgi:hypothetical protein
MVDAELLPPQKTKPFKKGEPEKNRAKASQTMRINTFEKSKFG